MSMRRWLGWFLGLVLAASLRAGAFQTEPPRHLSAPRDGPGPSCSRPEEGAQRILARGLGQLAIHDEAVESVAASLRDAYNVPLSFIENDDEVKISFAMSQATVQGVLDKLVERAPVYRYATIAGHLILYPRNSRWDARLDAVHLGPGPREKVASQLTDELERRLPAFAKFGMIIAGDINSYVYQDPVSVAGTGSVVELLARLLGARQSAIFSVYKMPGWAGPQLYLGGVHYWQAVKLTSPTKVVHVGEKIQLKFMGRLPDGTLEDMTAGACLTVYLASDENVITVSADGLVTARGSGEAWVRAENGNQADSLSITVAKSGSGGAASPPRARPSPPSVPVRSR